MRNTLQRSLRLQVLTGNLTAFLLVPLVFLTLKIMGYSLGNLKETRESVCEAIRGHKGGLLICANHLTMVDSVLIAWALFPLTRYIFSFRSLPWNLPERDNFQKNIFLATFCYLAKCIPINRRGDRGALKANLEKCTSLLKRGESILIFPEGGRSRSGYVDPLSVSYGAGRLIQSCPEARVLCVYQRGVGQEIYSTIPRRNEKFFTDIQVAENLSEEPGLKGQRAIATQIGRILARMEARWFQRHAPQMHIEKQIQLSATTSISS